MDETAARAFRETNCELVLFPLVSAAHTAPGLRWTRAGIQKVTPPAPLYWVNLGLPFEEYLRKFSSSTRKHLKRDVARLREANDGETGIREYRDPASMAEFQATARLVSSRTYQERLLGAGFPDTPEFLAAMIDLAKQDSVRAYVLFHQERPIAFAYCSGQDRYLTYRIIGYDPEYRDYSPGRTLLYLILEKLFAEGRFDAFDFGPGEAVYKASFATDFIQCSDVYYFRPSMRNACFAVIQSAMASISRQLAAVTAKLGVKENLKRWMRRSFSR